MPSTSAERCFIISHCYPFVLANLSPTKNDDEHRKSVIFSLLMKYIHPYLSVRSRKNTISLCPSMIFLTFVRISKLVVHKSYSSNSLRQCFLSCGNLILYPCQLLQQMTFFTMKIWRERRCYFLNN